MRIFIILFMLSCCITVCAQPPVKNQLNGTYILSRVENNGFLFDFEDTLSTLKRAFQHQLENRAGHMEGFDSLKAVTRLRNNLQKVYISTRFQITFNSNGTYKWSTWYQPNKALAGTYVINENANLITFTHYDEKLKKNNKMYFKLLFPISDTLVVQSDTDGKGFEDGKMTLKKQ